MRIAIYSASAAVRRALEAMVSASGHHVATGDEPLDCILADSLHPVIATNPGIPILTLGGPASDTAIPCPVRPERVIQRLMVLGQTQTVALANGWQLDMLARELVHANGSTASLTEKEANLLKYLSLAQPAALSRHDLLTQVWGIAGEVDTHTIETHIYRLRAKLTGLTPRPCDILTMDGAYMLALDEENR
jgi:hypothetical protein